MSLDLANIIVTGVLVILLVGLFFLNHYLDRKGDRG